MRRRVALILLGTLAASACEDAGTQARLAALERRLSVLEAQRAPEPPASVTLDATAGARDLERRLASLEQRVRALAEDAARSAAGSPVADPAAGRRAQRERLRDLNARYRDRLAAIRTQQVDPVARQEAVREALQWYRTERRAVLGGGREPDEP